MTDNKKSVHEMTDAQILEFHFRMLHWEHEDLPINHNYKRIKEYESVFELSVWNYEKMVIPRAKELLNRSEPMPSFWDEFYNKIEEN